MCPCLPIEITLPDPRLSAHSLTSDGGIISRVPMGCQAEFSCLFLAKWAEHRGSLCIGNKRNFQGLTVLLMSQLRD